MRLGTCYFHTFAVTAFFCECNVTLKTTRVEFGIHSVRGHCLMPLLFLKVSLLPKRVGTIRPYCSEGVIRIYAGSHPIKMISFANFAVIKRAVEILYGVGELLTEIISLDFWF